MHQLNVLNTAKRRCENYPSALNLRKMSAIARDVNIFIELDTAVFVDSFTKRNSRLNGCFKIQKILKTSNVPNVMIQNNVKLQRNVDIAEAFNAFFASVFNHKPSALSDFSDKEINSVQITQNDVCDALYLSTPGKGHDGISGDFLKTCCFELSFHVYKLFQSILHSGIYPEEWKIAKLTPLFKSTKKHDVTFYRPISLLSKLSLSFERVIYKKLYKFIAPKLSTGQIDSLKGRSTITQLLLFLSTYNTRLSEKPMFHLPKVKKTRTTHDFFYRVPKLVNYFHANTNLDIFNNPASFKYSAAAEFNKLFLLDICNLDQLHM